MDMKIIIRNLAFVSCVALFAVACGGGASTQETRTAVFGGPEEAKFVVQEIVDSLVIPEVVVFDLVDALASVLEGGDAQCSNAPIGTATFDVQAENRVVATFDNCADLSDGVNFIAGVLNGAVTTEVLSNTAELQEFEQFFKNFRLDDPVFPFGLEGNVRARSETRPNGDLITTLLSNDFALLFDDTVLRFVELDRQSEVTVDGFERLDFRGVLDGFGFQGVAGFDTEVPIVLDIARGDIDQGVLVVDGLNFSSIRITDSDSRNLADVAIDFDGDGITDLEAIWTWFGDVFPPLN